MSKLVPYQEPRYEIDRQVRRGMIEVRNKMGYVAAATQEAQESIANIHKEGVCQAVQTLAGTSVLIKAMELEGADPDHIARLREGQATYLDLLQRVEVTGSVKVACVVHDLPELPGPSALERLERWAKDYR